MRAAAICIACVLLALASEAMAEWRYKRNSDALTDEAVVHATTRSTNVHQFGFPYKGGTRAYLSIRQAGASEPDVMFIIDRGQLLCRPDCKVRLRFDDEPEALDYGGSPTSDGSSDTIFIRAEEMLIDRLKTARRLRVEVTVYNEGLRVFDFAVAKLNWPPKKK